MKTPSRPTSPEDPQVFEDRLSKAIELQQQWHFEKAREQYEEILRHEPENADACHNLGVLFAVHLLCPQQALSYFEAALSVDPTRLQFWYSYLDALIKADMPDMAEHVLVLAASYGLKDLQVESLRRDIRLARANVEELVSATLADAPPLPAPVQPLQTAQKPSQEPPAQELQRLLNLFNQKKYKQVTQIAYELLERFPTAAAVWRLLAESEQKLGHVEQSLKAKSKAAALRPADADVQMTLAETLLTLQHEEQAREVLQRILAMDPEHAQANGKMGWLFKKEGQLEAAARSYAYALRKAPQDPVLLEKFGSVKRTLGYADAALTCFKAAVQASPDSADLLDAYGQTLCNHDRLAAAEDAFRRALQVHPGHTSALRNLCHLLERHGRFQEAEAGLLRCAEIDSEAPESLYEIGRNLVHQKREKEALNWLRRAIQTKPDFVAAHVMLSAALDASEEPSEALEEIRNSLRLLPNIPHLHANLGIINLQLSRTDEAIRCFRAALALDRNFVHARSSMLFALSHSAEVGAKTLAREHRLFGKLMEKSVKGQVFKTHANDRDPGRPLRIGFVSADFRNHAMAKFVIPFFDGFAQRPEFMSYAYVNHGARDQATQAIQRNMDVWHSVVQWSNEQLAEQIRKDEIDILIDMSGHTAGNRLEVFARHPAPIQVTWGGYPGTTGLAAMDYRFVEHFFLESEGFKSQFTEKFVQLPAVSPFNGLETLVDVVETPCLANGFLTLGSFNRLNKINREVVAAWCQVLKALPDSRLLMAAMPANGVPPEVLSWFEQEGVDMQRITFHPRTDFVGYLELHAQVDLCLDTFPYTGGTTTNHALWMGVPTLTIAGDTYQSRQSAVFLRRVGLECLCVSDSLPALVEQAVAWAAQPQMLNQVRQDLQAHLSQAHAAQRDTAVLGVAHALRHMWQLWCAGQAPQDFRVEYEDIGMVRQTLQVEKVAV